MLATSRAFGDAKLKRYGVSAEPDIVRYTISKSNPAAFMVIEFYKSYDKLLILKRRDVLRY